MKNKSMFTKEELEAIDKLPYLAENGRWKRISMGF